MNSRQGVEWNGRSYEVHGNGCEQVIGQSPGALIGRHQNILKAAEQHTNAANGSTNTRAGEWKGKSNEWWRSVLPAVVLVAPSQGRLWGREQTKEQSR